MGFKDLVLLKEKDNRILLIFVVWMIVAHILENFLKISTVYVIIPLLCCTSTLLVISYVQKKDLSQFSWKQYVGIFLLSNFFGIVPYFLYLLNLIYAVIFIIVFLIIALILYSFVPFFHHKEIFFYPISFIIWFLVLAVAFTFFLLFIPSFILYKSYKKRDKVEVKISNYKHPKFWQLLEFLGGTIIGLLIISLTYTISSNLINIFGEVGFDLPGISTGILGFMTLVVFLTAILLFFRIFNAWMGLFCVIVGFYGFYLMIKAFYVLSFSGGAVLELLPILLPFSIIIDFGIFIIDLLLFLFIFSTFIKSTELLGKKKAWRIDALLLWFLISQVSYEFINIVSGEDMLGIKNGVAFSFFILVGFVGIYGLILYGKEVNKSKIFLSRKFILLFFILGFLAFATFTVITGLLRDLIPILSFSVSPVFYTAFSLCFSIVVISGLISYYISEKKRSLDDETSLNKI
ncbi:MAG: hypothetical protein KGD68_14000 [Candidatus Lokiarchaeota archaeon]|nr:hypothetical protein [Candidatus Lokiarchaeota archaeon]